MSNLTRSCAIFLAHGKSVPDTSYWFMLGELETSAPDETYSSAIWADETQTNLGRSESETIFPASTTETAKSKSNYSCKVRLQAIDAAQIDHEDTLSQPPRCAKTCASGIANGDISLIVTIYTLTGNMDKVRLLLAVCLRFGFTPFVNE